MSSKTKIVVLHMKEIIYTGIFLLFLVILGILMFLCSGRKNYDGFHRRRRSVHTRSLPYFR